MTQRKVLKIVAGIALIVAGLISIFLGFIIALIVDASWLLLSLFGLASVIIGGVIIGREAKRALSTLGGALGGSAPKQVRSKVKK